MHLFVLSFLLLPLILLAEEVNLPTSKMPEEFSSLPAKERVFRVIIKVVNPDALIKFMEVGGIDEI